MIRWKRNNGVQITKNFHAREFQCTCGICLDQQIDRELVERLQSVRDELGLPLTITSAFRCARRQQQLRSSGIETAVGTSSHEMGMAVDVTCSDMPRLLAACEKRFDNIGTAKTFLHVDVRGPKGRKRRWVYSRA